MQPRKVEKKVAKTEQSSTNKAKKQPTFTPK